MPINFGIHQKAILLCLLRTTSNHDVLRKATIKNHPPVNIMVCSDEVLYWYIHFPLQYKSFYYLRFAKRDGFYIFVLSSASVTIGPDSNLALFGATRRALSLVLSRDFILSNSILGNYNYGCISAAVAAMAKSPTLLVNETESSLLLSSKSLRSPSEFFFITFSVVFLQYCYSTGCDPSLPNAAL